MTCQNKNFISSMSNFFENIFFIRFRSFSRKNQDSSFKNDKSNKKCAVFFEETWFEISTIFEKLLSKSFYRHQERKKEERIDFSDPI